MKLQRITGTILSISLVGALLSGCGSAGTSTASANAQGPGNHRNFQNGASNAYTWSVSATPASPKAGQSFTVKVSLQAKNGQAIPDGDLEAAIISTPAQRSNGNDTSGSGGGGYGNHTSGNSTWGGNNGSWGNRTGTDNGTGSQGRPRGFGGPTFTLKRQSDGTYLGTLTAPASAGQYMIRVGFSNGNGNTNPRGGIRHTFPLQVQS